MLKKQIHLCCWNPLFSPACCKCSGPTLPGWTIRFFFPRCLLAKENCKYSLMIEYINYLMFNCETLVLHCFKTHFSWLNHMNPPVFDAFNHVMSSFLIGQSASPVPRFLGRWAPSEHRPNALRSAQVSTPGAGNHVSWTWSTWNMVNSNNQLTNINNITSWYQLITTCSYWSCELRVVNNMEHGNN